MKNVLYSQIVQKTVFVNFPKVDEFIANIEATAGIREDYVTFEWIFL